MLKHISSPRKDFAKACTSCTCAATGGFMASHAGCFATPLVLSATGLAVGSLGSVFAAVALVGASAGGSYFLWRKLRGAFASTLERRFVKGSLVGGTALSLALHFGGGHHGQDDHHHAPHTVSDTKEYAVYLDDPQRRQQVQDWIGGLSDQERKMFSQAAEQSGMTLYDYAALMCITPQPSLNKPQTPSL